MSSVIIMPEELKTNQFTYHQADSATYTFTPTDVQKANIQRLYRDSNEKKLQFQMQFYQSSNQLYGSSIVIVYTRLDNSTTTQTLHCSGTFYTIDEFYIWLLAQIATMGTSMVYEQDLLQNQGLFNLKPGELVQVLYKHIQVTFVGYNLIEMLGLSHGIDSPPAWEFNIPQAAPALHGVKRFYMPVIKQFNVCTSLQKSGTLYFDQFNKQHNVITRVINSVQAGDFALLVENVPLGQLTPDDLQHFTITFYDQNFQICKFLDDLKICITFSDAPVMPKAQRLITNRTM